MSGTSVATLGQPGNWVTQTINGMQYDVLLPAGYDSAVQYPTLLYLHQLDMGNDPSGLLAEVDPWFNTAAFRSSTPAIIVMPLLDQSADPSGQTINFGGISSADNPGETNAIAALKQVMSQYSSDPSRIYVSGNSMGGIGTEDMLIKFNAYTGTEDKIFAAGLALAGADYGQGYPQPNAPVVTALKNVPFWAIHGGQDTQVPLTWDQNLYAAEQAIGGVMKYTQDGDLGHDVWDTYYPQAGPGSPLDWLFRQSTGTSPPDTSTPPVTPTVTASPNNTAVTDTGAAITDASGNKWTITGSGQVAVNGTADATTANVVELAYVNGTIWQENSSKLWWGEATPNASWSPAAGTATSPLPATPSTPSTPTVTASPNNTAVTGTAAAITDANGNKWTITGGSQVAVNGMADTTTANVVELAYVNGTIWQENSSKLWWGEATPNASWSPAAGTAISPLPATPSTPSTPASGTRNPFYTPFASDSVFNLPLGSNAQWQANAQLAGATVYVNTATGSGYNENIYQGSAADPLITITNNAASGGTAGVFQVHIPAGAVPANGNDATFSVDDTTSHTWYSFGGFNWTGTNSASVSQGSGESDFGSGIVVANSNWDQGVGALRQHDLQAGIIDHMLRMEIPTTMAMSYSKTSTTTLAPYAWPQTEEDGFAINGNGGTPYSGTVPFGATIGIAASAVEPMDVAANPGAHMLWQALQTHGAMIRDTGGSGNTVIFQADQDVSPNDPLIQGMQQYSAMIMAASQVLINQGPNSINGGGTPVVPLNPEPNDAPAATPAPADSPNNTMVLAGATNAVTDTSGNKWTITSSNQVAVNGATDATTANVTELAYVNKQVWQENASNLWWGKTTPDASWSPAAGTSTSPLPPPVTIAADAASVTVSQSQVSVIATAGTHMLFISGAGDVVSLSGGANTITDTGSGNTYILPAAGKGTASFTSNILAQQDTLSLKTSLAATDWDGSNSTLSAYLTVAESAKGVTLSVAATSGGSGVAIATIDGVFATNLSELLVHAIT